MVVKLTVVFFNTPQTTDKGKKMMKLDQRFIQLPRSHKPTELEKNERRIKTLGTLLGDYSAILYSPRNYKAPEQQMLLICLVRILGVLLAEGIIDYAKLGRNLAKEYGTSFDPNAFIVARGRIAQYCSGGRNRLPPSRVFN